MDIAAWDPHSSISIPPITESVNIAILPAVTRVT